MESNAGKNKIYSPVTFLFEAFNQTAQNSQLVFQANQNSFTSHFTCQLIYLSFLFSFIILLIFVILEKKNFFYCKMYNNFFGFPGRVLSPSVPYAAVIPQGVEKNKTIIVQGLVTSSGHNRFAVNLCCGVRTEGDHRDDIALHIDVRFGLENIVVLNSLIQDTWGTEERHRNPCRRGQPFRIKITVFQDRYQMAMNQDLFIEYRHRVPIENIKVLQIEGCVVVDIIEYAYSEAHIVKDYILNHIDEYSIENPKETIVLCPKMPVSVPIKYSKDHFPVIFMNTKMVRLPSKFEIDFLAGEDIALHSKFSFDEQIIVRNARLNGKWGAEEQRSYCFPFIPQYHEDFEITCDEKRFAVRAGDLHLYSFLHRIEPYLIDTLRITGDVKIIKIRIK